MILAAPLLSLALGFSAGTDTSKPLPVIVLEARQDPAPAVEVRKSGKHLKAAAGGGGAKRGAAKRAAGQAPLEPAPQAPPGAAEQRSELPPADPTIDTAEALRPPVPVSGDWTDLPGDRVPDECDECGGGGILEFELEGAGTGRVSTTSHQIPAGGMAGSGGAAGGSAGAAGAGGGAAAVSGGGGVQVGGLGDRLGAGAGMASSPTARASGGDELRVDLGETRTPPDGKLKGGMNAGAVREIQDAFAALGGGSGMMRINLRIDEEESANHAAWQAHWAHEAGSLVLVTALGTPLELASTSSGEQIEGGLPLYARSVPTDIDAWALAVIDRLEAMEAASGDLPDYLEVWNEPDRFEFFDGRLEQYLEMYSALAPLVKSRFPAVKVGGMGLAGSESPMDGGESALLALVDRAAQERLPLDFVSWHNYGMGADMRYTRIGELLRARLARHGLGCELLVSEWNVRPNTQAGGSDFDDSHAAANFVTFLTSCGAQGVDGNAFFMLYDQDEQEGVADLTGRGVGAVTLHGVKKPVWRAMEMVFPILDHPRFQVRIPADEYALGLLAGHDGQRIRIVVSNDAVEPEWVWGRGCREIGLLPGETATLVAAAGGSPLHPPTRAALMAQGLSGEQADGVLNVIARVQEAADLKQRDRSLALLLEGVATVNVSRVWRFDSSHNAPVEHREALLPHLEAAEAAALAAAEAAAADQLIAFGVQPPSSAPEFNGDLEVLAAALGVTVEQAQEVLDAYRSTLRVARLRRSDFLNSLPGAALASESAAEAGLVVTGNRIEFALEPDSLIVLEIIP